MVDFLNGTLKIAPYRADLEACFGQGGEDGDDFCEVKGQEHAKRALEVAAAGMPQSPDDRAARLRQDHAGAAHPLHPARPCSFEEAIETTKVYSVMGLLERDHALVASRPFRSPHHTISDVGLIGGSNTPKPGEVSLSHNGVLFLDELPEFKKHVLEVLRQPMEDGKVTISRALSCVTYPCPHHAGRRHEPLPLRLPGRPRPSLLLHAAHDPALPLAHLRAASGPHRHPHRGAGGEVPRSGRPERRRELGGHRGARGPVAGSAEGALHGDQGALQRPDDRPDDPEVLRDRRGRATACWRW